MLCIHGASETVYHTHATTSVSTTEIQFYRDKAMVNQEGIAKERAKSQ